MHIFRQFKTCIFSGSLKHAYFQRQHLYICRSIPRKVTMNGMKLDLFSCQLAEFFYFWYRKVGWNGWQYQHVQALCTIVPKGNIKGIFFFYVCIIVIILYVIHLYLVEFVGLACVKYAFTFLFLTRVWKVHAQGSFEKGCSKSPLLFLLEAS